MLLTILIIANIPIYLLIAWLIFDTQANAADTIFDTVVSILKAIFIPRFVRVLMEDDDGGADTLMLVVFLFLCGIIVYGQYFLIEKYFFS